MSGRERLAGAFLAGHPEAAARLLETLPADAVGRLAEATDAASAAHVFGQMLPSYAARCVEHVAPERVAEILQKMGSQDAVALLRHLVPHARLDLLAALPQQWSAAFTMLLRYPPNAVGAWAEPLVLTLPADCSVGEARERVENHDEVVKARIYVLDRSRHVRGAVRSLALLRNGAHVRLAAILEPAKALWARETLATALESDLWERNAEAPVVNRTREFIGAVSYADLRRAQRRQSRAPAAAEHRQGLSEVAELLATGAGGIWQSFGEWVRSDPKPR